MPAGIPVAKPDRAQGARGARDFVAPSRFVLRSPNFLDAEYLGPYLTLPDSRGSAAASARRIQIRVQGCASTAGGVSFSSRATRSVGVAIACAILLGSSVLTEGCGDGIGRPIRVEVSSAGGSVEAGVGAYGGAGPAGLTGNGPATAWTGPAGGSAATGPMGTTVPITSIAYCSATLSWPSEQAAAEDDLLVVLNLLRQSGQVTCVTGSSGVVGPPLVMSDQLRCSARLHSLIMAQNGILTSFVGDTAVTRIALTGYSANQTAEVITTSEPANVDVAALLDRLVTGGGTDCANLLDPSFTSVGIGFAPDSAQGYWTIDLASP